MSFQNIRPPQPEPSYDWRARQGRRERQAGGGATKWALIAIGAAVVLHLGLLFAARNIEFVRNALTITSEGNSWKDLERVTAAPPEPTEEIEPIILPDATVLAEPPEDVAQMLDEMEVLDVLPPDFELDITPAIDDPAIAMRMEVPALAGDVGSDVLEPIKAPEIEIDLPDTGVLETELLESQEGRIVIDPGAALADEFDPDELTKDLARKGVDSLSDEGVPEGFTTLDKLLTLPGNALISEKSMIGSDLLFEFNKSELRESARFSLMKVALLIDKNPEMFCWIEGHADLVGGEEYNRELSRLRAQAVKDWLVTSLALDGDRIIVRALGQDEPLVQEGDQALNRRVEIKMRNTPPEGVPAKVRPTRAIAVDEADLLPPPVVVEEPAAEPEPEVTRAERVEIPRAEPVDPFQIDPPVAEPVVE